MATTRPGADYPDAAGASFDCKFCRRPEECNLPAVDEDGHTPLLPSEVVDIYNERRHKHYLTDFATADALRDHLTERALYWTQGKPQDVRNAALETVGPCVEWWGIAHPAHAEARRAIARIEELQLEAEARKFAGLTPTQKFALIRQGLESVGSKLDLNKVLAREEKSPRHDKRQVHDYLVRDMPATVGAGADPGVNFWEGTGL